MDLITILIIIWVLLCLCVLYRTWRVYALRGWMIEEAHVFSINLLREEGRFTMAAWDALDAMPSYELMVLKFWIPIASFKADYANMLQEI